MTTENGSKAGETPPADKNNPPKDPPNPQPPQDKKPDPTPTAEELAKKLVEAEARIAELNKENQSKRQKSKELETLTERQKKALELLTGKSEEPPDPAELQRKATEEKIRSAYLKAAFVVEAKDMHDADFSFSALRHSLSDVSVNIDTGEVDRAALKTKLGEVRKAQPFLFVQPSNNSTKSPPPNNPDGNGRPAGGGNPYQEWITMKSDPLRVREAQEFYAKNRVAILASMK